MRSASATAHANIALVKYWGKRDPVLNLPARGSLSLTLAAFSTTTEVAFDDSLAADDVTIDDEAATGAALLRVSSLLDRVRARAGVTARARVWSASNFPAASGLASSASAFAALASAAARAADLSLSPREMSILARHGSGSAARSVFGGLVRMHAGDRDEDAYAEPIMSPWSDAGSDLRMVIAIVGGGVRKKHGSRDAMEHCAATSPLYESWLATVDPDLAAAESAIASRDLHALGTIMESSALTMHASMWAARPAIRYWHPDTLTLIDRVVTLRDDGVPAYFTIDAGPHVKVLTDARHATDVERALRETGCVTRVAVSEPGPGVVV